MDGIVALISGAFGGGAFSFLLRSWIAERLKQSISHEYSTKLESVRSQFSEKLEEVKHANQVDQLRTSLFFDHQRSAFVEIIAKVAELHQEWQKAYDPNEGIYEPVPSKPKQELESLYLKHQLFLDSDLIMALELLFEIYNESLPFFDGNETHNPDVERPYRDAEYLQPRLAAVFRLKIGVGRDDLALRQLALLGAIRMLNRYHFPLLELPVRGVLQLKRDERAADAVNRAEQNISELLERMRLFKKYLSSEGFFHEAEASLRRYSDVLEGSLRPPA